MLKPAKALELRVANPIPKECLFRVISGLGLRIGWLLGWLGLSVSCWPWDLRIEGPLFVLQPGRVFGVPGPKLGHHRLLPVRRAVLGGPLTFQPYLEHHRASHFPDAADRAAIGLRGVWLCHNSFGHFGGKMGEEKCGKKILT